VDSKPKKKKRVGCIFCSNSRLFDYMCMHLPLIPWSIAGVLSSRALPDFPTTVPPPVCVPDFRSGASELPDYCTPIVCISDIIGLLTVWRHNKPKTKKTISVIGALAVWRQNKNQKKKGVGA